MEIQDFIKNFIDQLEEHDGSEITMETEFRKLEVWDSLTGAAVQIMISDNYNAPISDSDFKNAKTIADLYELTLMYQKK